MSESSDTPINARKRILRAALSVFAEFGYDGASTREIARRAQVHQPAIAYHFRNKEDLWKTAIESVYADLYILLDAEPPSKLTTPEERLRYFVSIFARYVADTPEWASFVVHEGMQTSERSRWFVTHLLLPLSQRLFSLLTGKDWPTQTDSNAFEAISLLSILTGSTVIFGQQSQVLFMSGVDTRSEAFLDYHIGTILRVLQNLLAER